MKKVFTFGLILIVPFLLSAQQKGNSQQDLQKQIEEMKKEMQSEITALEDSVAMLKDQLHKERENSSKEFFYQNPLSEKNKSDLKQLDSLLRDHEGSWSWSYSYPQATPYDFQFLVPPQEYKNELKKYKHELEWQKFMAPQCPELSRQKHKHEWMKMLPFYRLFKS